MNKIHLTTLSDGRLGIISIEDDEKHDQRLAKTLFELSRDGTDMLTHFDPDIHTLATIEAGIQAHTPLVSRDCVEADLPEERALRETELTFRDAWEDTGAKVNVNMPKARGIHMDRIRAVRNSELEKESGSKFRQPAEIESLFTPERQALLQVLRDIPQVLDLNTLNDTPEELKAVWPTELPARE